MLSSLIIALTIRTPPETATSAMLVSFPTGMLFVFLGSNNHLKPAQPGVVLALDDLLREIG